MTNLSSLHGQELFPIVAQAQSMVPKPHNLNLDEWISEPIPKPSRVFEPEENHAVVPDVTILETQNRPVFDPFYITDTHLSIEEDPIEEIPIVDVSLEIGKTNPAIPVKKPKKYKIIRDVLPEGFVSNEAYVKPASAVIVDADALALQSIQLEDVHDTGISTETIHSSHSKKKKKKSKRKEHEQNTL